MLQPPDSFMRNCTVLPRDEATEELFYAYTDEKTGKLVVLARLDGYTILPTERYEALCRVPSSSV